MSHLRAAFSLILLLLLAAGVSIYVIRELGREESEFRPLPPAPRTSPQDGSQGPLADAPHAKMQAAREIAAPLPASPPASMSIRFREATNYLEFARAIHAAAKAGDADAQYFLYRALNYCTGLYRAYFGGPGRSRTLDAGLQWAVDNSPHLDVEEARQVHERCQPLVESGIEEFGERGGWLREAARRGQPLAQIKHAEALVQDSAHRSPERQRALAAQANDLAVAALKSGEPEVLPDAGRLLLMRLKEGEVSDIDAYAWEIAACLRGRDCGTASAPAREACRFVTNCQPYETLPDMLRRSVADGDALDARAAEISRLIDAGDWDGLGFGPRSLP